MTPNRVIELLAWHVMKEKDSFKLFNYLTASGCCAFHFMDKAHCDILIYNLKKINK